MYSISYCDNEVYQAINVVSDNEEKAVRYFKKHKPSARFIGISKNNDYKPGKPCITVPKDF